MPADIFLAFPWNFLLRFAPFSCKMSVTIQIGSCKEVLCAHGLQLSLGAVLECFRSSPEGLEHFFIIGRGGYASGNIIKEETE